MKIFRCPICNLLMKEDQLKNGRCFQDGAKVRDVTKTKRAQRLITIYEREAKEETK